MVTYVVLAKFTDQGIRNAKESPKRADAFKKMRRFAVFRLARTSSRPLKRGSRMSLKQSFVRASRRQRRGNLEAQSTSPF